MDRCEGVRGMCVTVGVELVIKALTFGTKCVDNDEDISVDGGNAFWEGQ